MEIILEAVPNFSGLDKNADYIMNRATVIKGIEVKGKSKNQKKIDKIIKDHSRTLEEENVSVIYK